MHLEQRVNEDGTGERKLDQSPAKRPADRGLIHSISLSIEYPDGRTITAPFDPGPVAQLLLDDEECRRAAPELWDTGNWETNPTFVAIHTDGTLHAACSPDSHITT